MSRVNDGVAQSPYPSLKAFHDEVGVTGGDSWDEFYNTYRFGYDPTDLQLGDRMARFWDSPANSIYARATFALDARRTPGVPAAGNTIQDLSPNALRTQNGTTGNAKIVQDGAGGKALLTPGTTGSYASTPDAAALDITGDIDLRVHVAMDDWSSAYQYLLTKWTGGSSPPTNRSYALMTNLSGGLRFLWSDGTTIFTKDSTAGHGVANGAAKWLRATLDVDNGAAGNDVRFYTSDDGVSWTQLGSTVTTAGVTAIASGTSQLEIGGAFAGTSFSAQGRFFQAQVYSGIDATLVADFDPSRDASYSSLSWTSATTGETWTVTPGGSDNSDVLFLPAPSTLGVTRYVYNPSMAGNGLTVPDSADWTPTTTLDARVWVSLDDWTPSSETALFGHYETTGNQRAWMLSVWTTGTLFLRTCPDGITAVTAASTAATGATDGGWLGLRAVWDATTPSVTFYTRTDSAIDSDTGWTTLGTVVTGATVAASVFNSTSTLSIGPQGAGNTVVPNGTSRIGRAIVVKDSTEVFDWSAEDTVNSTHTTYTASTGQTVTVNRATSGRKTVVVEAAKWLLGTDDYLEVPDSPLLDLDAATDFTVLAVVRQHATPVNFGRYVDKRDNAGASGLGWSLQADGTALGPWAGVDDGPDLVIRRTSGLGASTFTAGSLQAMGFQVNRTAATLAIHQQGAVGATASISAVGSVANTVPMRIGRDADAGTSYQDFELYAVYVWREALTASELAAIAADWGAV